MFYSVKELIQSAKESRRDAWELILMDDANERNVSQKESFEKMRYMWHSMKKSVESYDPNLVSPSGLSGKNGGKMEKYIPNCVSGEFLGNVLLLLQLPVVVVFYHLYWCLLLKSTTLMKILY